MTMSRYRLASVFTVSVVVLAAFVSVTVSYQAEGPPKQAGDNPGAEKQDSGNRSSKLAIEQKWESPAGQIVDRTANQQLTRIIGMIQQGNENTDYATILRQLQRILRSDEDAFVTSDPLPIEQRNPLYVQRAEVSLRSIKSVVEQIINELPKKGRNAYDRLYGVEAATIAKSAIATNDTHAIELIARERFHTKAGHEAAYRLGNRSLEQNRPVTALRHLERLRKTNARKRWEPLLSLKIAGAWSQLGRTDKALQTVEELRKYAKQKPAMNKAFNRLVNRKTDNDDDLIAQIAQLMPVNSAAIAPSPEWPVYMGNVNRTAEPAPFSPVGEPIWKSSTLGYFEAPTQKELQLFKFDPSKGKTHLPESELEMAAAIQVGLDKLAERELTQFQPSIPASYPLVVNSIAVFRTLNRVRAVEINSGELLWETFTEDPSFAEQFAVDSIRQVNSRVPNNDLTSPMNRFQESFLTARTRTDRTTGTLSCDGELVYYIEGCGIPDPSITSVQRRTGQSKIQSFNRLCAVELETGLLRWEIGGPRNEFSLSSAGRYFLGPPTPVEDQLFVLVEEDAAVRLIGLDQATGEQVWAQSISQPHAGVSYEGLRRVAGDMPTFVDGLLICPTSAGQLVAFDVAQRRLVWNFQYASQLRAVPKDRRLMFRGNYVSTNRLNLGSRWSDNAVVSYNGRLLITPLDAESLFCVDVQSGEELWRKPRQNGSYLATIADDSVIIVESTGVRSISIKDGEQKWFVPLEYRRVSGRGLRTGNLFHLPVAVKVDPIRVAQVDEKKNTEPPPIKKTPDDKKPDEKKPDVKPADADKKPNEQPTKPITVNPADTKPQAPKSPVEYVSKLRGGILTIDIEKGIVLAESGFAAGTGIGNLAASNGMLIAQSFDSVIALEPLASITKRINESLKNNPDDSKILALQGQLAFHQGNVDVGLETLTKAVTLGAGQKAQDALLRAILERLRFGGDLPESAIKLLEKSATGRLKFTVQRIRAESFVRKGEYKTAFETLLVLSQDDALKNPNFEQQLDSVTMSGNRWIGGRLQDVYKKAKATDQAAATEIDKLVASDLVQVLAKKDELEFKHWLDKYRWHPESINLRAKLIAEFDPKTEFLKMERHMAANIHVSGKAQQLKLRAQLLQHWMANGAIRGVAYSIDEFANSASDEKLGSGKTAVELATEWKADKQIAAVKSIPTWGTIPSVERTNEVATPRLRVLLTVNEPRSSALRGLNLEVDTTGGKFRAINQNGNNVWEISIARLKVPRTNRFQSVSYSQARVFSSGHLLVLRLGSSTGGLDFYVFDISGPEPRLLWNRMLAQGTGNTSNTPQLVANGRVISYASSVRGFYSVDALTNETLLYRTGNTLTAVDAMTGDVLWTRANVATNSRIIADEDHIAVLSPTNTDHNILSLYDGHLVKTTRLPTNIVLTNDGLDVTYWVTTTSGSKALVLMNALTGETAWRKSYDSTAHYRSLEDSRLVAIGTASGLIEIRNVDDGKIIVKAKGEELDLLSNIVAWSGLDHYVVFVAIPNTDRNMYVRGFTNIGIQQHLVHGLAYGINKKSGEITWTRDLPNILFHAQQPTNVPFFVLAAYSYKTDPITRRRTASSSALIVDSRTGEFVFEHTEPSLMRQYQTRSAASEGSAKVIFDRFVIDLDYNKKASE
jgi:outer membrane protein assembly factor BamB